MEKIYLSFLPLLLSVTLFMQCGSGEVKNVPQTDSFITDVELDAFFDALHKKGMFNGAVAVKKKGELILKKGYGTTNFSNSATPFLTQTPMEVASVSKQFTATAILLLEQDKKLQLEDPLQKYLGDDFPYATINVKHLVTHTSGLPDYEKHFRKHWDTTKIANNNDIVAYFKTNKPDLMSEPGKRYHYSNSGYVLLAEIVHAVSGKPLDVFLKERVFDVAGMSDTRFYDRDDIWTLPGYAPGFQLDLKTCLMERPEFLPGRAYYYFLSGRLGPGRLTSTVEDLIKWDAVLYGNDLLSDDGKAMAFTPYPAEEDDSDYGFGWHVVENDVSGKVVYHTGSWAGNQAYIRRYLADKSLFITLNNAYSPYMKQIRTAVEDYLAGKPLVMLDLIGVEVLKKEICKLDATSIQDWYHSNHDVSWSVDDLRKLSKQYQDMGDGTKGTLVDMVINYIENEN